ncbi:hypothetical protein [Pyxidicoccus sp. MSG2]|uniref:hypothetical protein n=1 Tax=Pyxidicoccus sp. MSG2 TaxID=2996790 RepID=UPI00227156ED|nr:hypothetical protein [Pyxidicoccus sp. MSG2]MCY1021296.1 hypothetical protein [Pyxidicoccus sp. MSG2]
MGNMRIGERVTRTSTGQVEEVQPNEVEVQAPPPPPQLAPAPNSAARERERDTYTPARAARANPARVPPPPARPPEEALRGDPGFTRLGEATQTAVLERARAAGNSPIAQQNLRELATNDGFAQLPPSNQRAMLDLQGQAPVDRQLTEQLGGLASNPNFRGLDEATRNNALGQLSRHPNDPAARQTLTRLATSPGFASMPGADQNRLLNLVGGTNVLSNPARQALDGVMGSAAFQGANAQGQQAQLNDFLTRQPAAPRVVSGLHGPTPQPRLQTTTIFGPTQVPNHNFSSGTAAANRYEVELDGRRIPVFMPRNPNPANGHSPTIEQVAQGLAVLPPASRALVNQVNVEPGQNPQDAYWRSRYANDPNAQNFRSYMTAGADGNITIYPSQHPQPQAVINDSLIHETGHTLSMRRWGDDNSGRRWGDWRNAIQRDGIRPSNYAANAPGEDFSESLVLYQRVRGTPQEAEVRAMMPERFRILDQMVGGGR